MTGKVVVVTGASSGFGKLAAQALARAGHLVYAGMRATDGEVVSAVSDRGRAEFRHRIGIAGLLPGHASL